MKNTKIVFGACLSAILSLGALAGCKSKSGADKYDKKGRLIIDMKNVYWDGFDGTDTYTETINDMFGVCVKPSSYDYSEWDGMVNTAINGDNLTDTFHFNLKAYNFGSTYEKWVDGMIVKALPDDLSKWPNIQAMLANISNLDALKIDGHLYGIPIANDISNPQKDFSNFTYVYRRDWAKKIDEEHQGQVGWTPIYKEGDVYTWEEFNKLVDAFQKYPREGQTSPLVDESWGFPSVTNFYKDVPHCYAKDANGRAINAFTSEKYVAGLNVAKQFVSDLYYSQDQFTFPANKANDLYKGGQSAILYDNFSYENYSKIRKGMKSMIDKAGGNLDDATALLKVKDPNGNYALEGTENWFSMTLFNYDISDKKMGKILDVINYLLGEEGTRLAIYGLEGYDYNLVNGEVELTSTGWEKDQYGNYAPKINGAKFLRYMATLGNDTKSYDPYTELDSYNLLNAWSTEMKEAKAAGKLRVVKEPADIDWMSTPTKNDKTESILADANVSAMKYAFNKISYEAYLKEFDNASWNKILAEINEKLGK